MIFFSSDSSPPSPSFSPLLPPYATVPPLLSPSTTLSPPRSQHPCPHQHCLERVPRADPFSRIYREAHRFCVDRAIHVLAVQAKKLEKAASKGAEGGPGGGTRYSNHMPATLEVKYDITPGQQMLTLSYWPTVPALTDVLGKGGLPGQPARVPGMVSATGGGPQPNPTAYSLQISVTTPTAAKTNTAPTNVASEAIGDDETKNSGGGSLAGKAGKTLDGEGTLELEPAVELFVDISRGFDAQVRHGVDTE